MGYLDMLSDSMPLVILLILSTLWTAVVFYFSLMSIYKYFKSPKKKYNRQIMMIDYFTQESQHPKYENEVELFKAMSIKEQQEYLDLSRDEKLIKYGSKLQ